MGVEKARGVESDRIGLLILASGGDFSGTKSKKSVSNATPVGKGRSPGYDVHVTKESASAVDKLASTSTELASPPIADKSASTSSPLSTEHAFNVDYELDSDQYSLKSYKCSDLPTASPSSVSSAHVHTPPSNFYESLPPALSTYPVLYSPYHPPPSYKLSHSQSWPPNNLVSLCFMMYDMQYSRARNFSWRKYMPFSCPF